MAHPGGRPTAYSEEMKIKTIEFFDRPLTIEVERAKRDAKGNTFYVTEEVPNVFPTLTELAKHLGVARSTLYLWIKEHAEFSDIIKDCKADQENFLLQNALRGLYNPTFSIFTAKNVLDWRDKTEIDHTTKGEKMENVDQTKLTSVLEDMERKLLEELRK